MIINGSEIAKNIRKIIKDKVEKLSRKPGLAVILVGDNSASKIYVNNKEKFCQEVGFYSQKMILDKNISEKELIAKINILNNDEKIDGILVQLPLPTHINKNNIIATINPTKDVDGFHSENIGKLLQNNIFLRPCTPKGIMIMLQSINVDLIGKNAVVVGSSNIVGRPMAIELLNAGATITICNSKTKKIIEKIQNADILVAAVGKAEMIKGHWIKPGAIVIDVGINRLKNGKIVGDVEFEVAKERASFITPVPGGVGPMTIAALLENTLIAYKAKL